MTENLEGIINRIKAKNKKVGDVVELITKYGGIDGEWHKQWLLDQTLRNLLGPQSYQEWRKAYDSYTDEDGERDDEWDEGIAP